MKSPTTPNAEKQAKTGRRGPAEESFDTGQARLSLKEQISAAKKTAAKIARKNQGISDVEKQFKGLSIDKRKLITEQLGDIDGIIRRGLIGITDKDSALHLRYWFAEGNGDKPARPENLILKYTMDGNRITKADTSSASEHVSSHVRTDFAPASQGAVRPSRVNKVLLGAWIDPEYKRHLLMLKVKDPDRTTESLVQEALDDLFAKHSVPPVLAPRKKAKGFTQGD